MSPQNSRFSGSNASLSRRRMYRHRTYLLSYKPPKMGFRSSRKRLSSLEYMTSRQNLCVSLHFTWSIVFGGALTVSKPQRSYSRIAPMLSALSTLRHCRQRTSPESPLLPNHKVYYRYFLTQTVKAFSGTQECPSKAHACPNNQIQCFLSIHETFSTKKPLPISVTLIFLR